MERIRVYQPGPNPNEFIEQYRNDFRRYPRMNNATFFGKYVKIALLAKITHRKVSQREIDAAKYKLLRYLEDFASDEAEFLRYRSGLNKIWPNLAKRMQRSPAVLEYFMDFAIHSPSLANFMSWVPCSETMENARAYGYDIAGRYGKLDPDDVAFYWSLRTPVLAGICLRIQYAQEAIKKCIKVIRQQSQRPVRVLFVGAGRLPELRSYNASSDWFKDLEIVAVDEDSGVRQNIDELFQFTYDQTLEELGFVWVDRNMCENDINEIARERQACHRYYNMSFDEFKKRSEYNSYFDLIILDGVMSYYRNNTVSMLSSLRGLMCDEGQLIIDLQLLNIVRDLSLLQHKVALDWNTVPQLDPDRSIRSAYKRIKQDSDVAGLALDDAVLYPADPGKHPVMIGIGFTLRRQSNWRKTT